jgi:hypothetical protein
MSKVKAFFYIIFKSLTSTDYYREVIRSEPSITMKYFFALTLTVTVVATAVQGTYSVPRTREFVRSSIDHVRDVYPEDMVIKIEEGQMTINRPSPFIIPLPEAVQMDPEQQYENILVYDENGTLDDYGPYSTLFLVNKRNILVQGENAIEAYPIRNFPEGEFTYETYNQILNRITDLTRYIPYVVYLGLFFAYLVYFVIMRMIYLLVIALLLLGSGMIMSVNYKFSKYYQIGIHAMTLPLLVELIGIVTQTPVRIPYWFMIIHLIVGVVVLASLRGYNDRPENVDEIN